MEGVAGGEVRERRGGVLAGGVVAAAGEPDQGLDCALGDEGVVLVVALGEAAEDLGDRLADTADRAGRGEGGFGAGQAAGEGAEGGERS